jgi:ribosomal-protein-alanine N-acetyltransferase
MIRPATEGDVPQIKALIQSTAGLWNASWRQDVLERGIRSSDGLVFVCEQERQILGFVCAHDVGFRGYLSELVVAENARGRGIGRRLVRRVERELAERGCTTVIADVWKDAADFYRALGWTAPDVVLLRRRLPRPANPEDVSPKERGGTEGGHTAGRGNEP